MQEQPMIVKLAFILMLVWLMVEWVLYLSGNPSWELIMPFGMLSCGFLVGWSLNDLKGGE